MNYELKSAKANGLPFDKKENPLDLESPLIYGLNIIIRTGIVGQTYNGFQNTNVEFCPILRTDTVNEILAKINTFALAFVASEYPNT